MQERINGTAENAEQDADEDARPHDAEAPSGFPPAISTFRLSCQKRIHAVFHASDDLSGVRKEACAEHAASAQTFPGCDREEYRGAIAPGQVPKPCNRKPPVGRAQPSLPNVDKASNVPRTKSGLQCENAVYVIGRRLLVFRLGAFLSSRHAFALPRYGPCASYRRDGDHRRCGFDWTIG